MNQTDAALADARLIRAYQQVFGREGNRTNAQQAVWHSLLQQSRLPNYSSENGFDPIAAALNEGGRVFIENLRVRVETPLSITNENQESDA